MKRTLLVLWAFAIIAGFGFGAAPAQAYFTGESEWLNNIGGNSLGQSRQVERRSARNTKATRQHAARASSDDGVRPQTNRRARAQRAQRAERALPSLTGGSSASSGIASYYWQPQRVASGGWFNPNAMTAAHKTLPFGTKVLVTNLNNGRAVTVTINDRGPYVRGRVIDLSRAAAGAVGMTGAGLARVNVAVLGR